VCNLLVSIRQSRHTGRGWFCCSPEAVIDIDGLYYNVGGLLTDMPRAYLNRTALAENATFDPNAFHFVSYQTRTPEAPFYYRPRRGAPEDIVWPPRGLRLDVKFKAPFWAPFYHQVKYCVPRMWALLEWIRRIITVSFCLRSSAQVAIMACVGMSVKFCSSNNNVTKQKQQDDRQW